MASERKNRALSENTYTWRQKERTLKWLEFIISTQKFNIDSDKLQKCNDGSMINLLNLALQPFTPSNSPPGGNDGLLGVLKLNALHKA
jgi:hypothetical protein